MYRILCKRRLYRYKDGKCKRIKKDEVFEEQSITVFFRTVCIKDIGSEKIKIKVDFNQGSGDYELVNCRPLVERVYTASMVASGLLMLMLVILSHICDIWGPMLSKLIIVTWILWILDVFLLVFVALYINLTYQRYISQFKKCKVIKR